MEADREAVVQSLQKALHHDTRDFELHMLNYVADLQISHAALESRMRLMEADQLRQERKSISTKMLKLLKFDNELPIDDTNLCLNIYYVMDQATKARALWVVRSESVRQWLGSVASSALIVHGNHDAVETRSPLSLLCAKAVALFTSKPDTIVIRYFCGLHVRASKPRGNVSGMLNSLVGQLVVQAQRLGIDLDLAALDPEDLYGAKRDDLAALLRIFRQCVRRMPSSYIVHCIVDGVSFYEDNQRKNETLAAMRKLYRMVSAAHSVAFKLLVTAPARTRWVHSLFLEDEILEVPRYVTRDVQGFLDHELSGASQPSAAKPSKPRDGASGEYQESDWWNRNESRGSLVSVEG